MKEKRLNIHEVRWRKDDDEADDKADDHNS